VGLVVELTNRFPGRRCSPADYFFTTTRWLAGPSRRNRQGRVCLVSTRRTVAGNENNIILRGRKVYSDGPGPSPTKRVRMSYRVSFCRSQERVFRLQFGVDKELTNPPSETRRVRGRERSDWHIWYCSVDRIDSSLNRRPRICNTVSNDERTQGGGRPKMTLQRIALSTPFFQRHARTRWAKIG
jgi:hypothetical protein